MVATDTELVQRWQQGDAPSSLTLMDRYTPALAAVAMSVLHDPLLVEDALQETYLRAQRAIHRLNNQDSAGGFLAGITRNVANEMRRRHSREGQEARAEAVDSLTPALAAGREELSVRLREMVDKLPVDQRELFLMKYISGMRYREIARVLNTTETAVSQKLWRIRRSLQQGLKDFHE